MPEENASSSRPFLAAVVSLSAIIPAAYFAEAR